MIPLSQSDLIASIVLKLAAFTLSFPIRHHLFSYHLFSSTLSSLSKLYRLIMDPTVQTFLDLNPAIKTNDTVLTLDEFELLLVEDACGDIGIEQEQLRSVRLRWRLHKAKHDSRKFY
jgi:hypothetical protein